MKLREKIQASQLAKARKEARLRDREECEQLWRLGFLPSRADMYDFTDYEPQFFLSDLQREHTRYINGPYSAILDNKITFDVVFRNHARMPKSLGWISSTNSCIDIPDGAVFFVKPNSGGGGNGIIKAHREGDTIKSGESQFTIENFLNHIVVEGKYISISEAVAQHVVLENLFRETTNTLRILMMRDAVSSAPFIASAVLRVGTDSTQGVDNFSQGGLSVDLDLKTGRIAGGRTKRGEYYTHHPNSGHSLTGLVIPHWEEAGRICLEAMKLVPELQYVGWDVIIAQDGAVLLEGNNYSDVHLLQTHKPLLLSDQVRDFYRAQGVLDIRPNVGLHDKSVA